MDWTHEPVQKEFYEYRVAPKRIIPNNATTATLRFGLELK
jgi:hypothetical protein